MTRDADVWRRFGIPFYAALFGLGALWRHLAGREPAVPWSSMPPWLALGIGVSCGAAIGLLADAALGRARWARLLRRDVLEFLKPLDRGRAIAVGLWSGLGEEMFFRGAMQPAIGLLATSLAFGLLHGGVTRALRGWAAFACVVGAILGALYVWTGGILAPAAAHALINGVQLWKLAARSRR